jgi:hypothetical protein
MRLSGEGPFVGEHLLTMRGRETCVRRIRVNRSRELLTKMRDIWKVALGWRLWESDKQPSSSNNRSDLRKLAALHPRSLRLVTEAPL